MLPIIMLLFWLSITIILFAFGPYNYSVDNKAVLYLYLFAVHLALFIGYIRGLNSHSRTYKGKLSGVKLTKILIAANFLIFLFLLTYSGGGDVANIRLALVNPEEAYISGSTKEGISALNYIGIFTAPIAVLAVTLGIYYWKEVAFLYRIALISYIISTVMGGIGSSVRSSIVSILMMVSTSIAAAHFSGKYRLSRRSKMIMFFSILIVTVCFIYYFDFLAQNRSVGRDMMLNPLTLELPKEDHVMYKIIPENSHITYTVIAFYLSHSYSRLATALKMPFIGIGFGAGNSVFLIRNIIRITGWEWFEKLSYGMRLDRESGHGIFGVFWSTIYPWIASDVTFPGSIIVVSFIGYILAVTWCDILNCCNPIAVSAFSCIFFIIYSFPMNNPMQDGAGLLVFIGIPLMWIITRKYYIRCSTAVPLLFE